MHAYGREHDLDATVDDYYAILQEFPVAPVGFLCIDGHVLHTEPYWNATDIQTDIEICLNRGHDTVEATLALQHDEMCEFLAELLQEV